MRSNYTHSSPHVEVLDIDGSSRRVPVWLSTLQPRLSGVARRFPYVSMRVVTCRTGMPCHLMVPCHPCIRFGWRLAGIKKWDANECKGFVSKCYSCYPCMSMPLSSTRCSFNILTSRVCINCQANLLIYGL